MGFQSVRGCADLSVREPAPNLTLVQLTMAEMQTVLETGCPVSTVCRGRPESFPCTWGLGVSSCGPARLGIPLRVCWACGLGCGEAEGWRWHSMGTSRSAQRSRHRRAGWLV